MTAIILAFAVRPIIGEGDIAPVIFSVAMLVLLLVAVLTIQVDELIGDRERLFAQHRRISIIGWALAIPAILERVVMLFAPNPRLYVFGTLSWLLFSCFITGSLLRRLLQQREVTGEVISMSVSVYLMFAFSWGLLYVLIFERHPDAFSFGGSPMIKEEGLFPVFIYFSATTISTVGFGHIIPVGLQARYAAVAEAITGQVYLAILVARLVGLHMSRAADQKAQ